MNKRVLTMGILAAMLLTSMMAAFLNKPTTAQVAADIVVYQTDQKIVIDGIANEPVWLVAPSVKIPLTFLEGATASVTITAVHNGTHIFVLAQWSDSTESRLWSKPPPGGAGPPYEDRLAIMFEITTQMTNPCMLTNTNGAVTDGEVDLVHWHAARDDPDGLNYTQWEPNPPYPYASDQYSNTTARYRDVKKGVPLGTGANHWDWPAKGEWSNSTPTGTWTLELMRKLSTGDPFDAQLSVDSTIDASFAVYDGGSNETHAVKSISSWKTIELSSASLLSLITGPQGPQGETGAQGPAGPTGPEGPAGAPAPDWVSYSSIGAIVIAVIAVALSFLKRS